MLMIPLLSDHFDTLYWTLHIDIISNNISRTLGVMNKLKQFFNRATLLLHRFIVKF